MVALTAAVVAAAVLSVVASVSSAAADSPTTANGGVVSTPPPIVSDANYRIAEEDVLRMDVWGEPQLSNIQIPVTPGGMISVPYLGDVKAAGLTQAELAKEIAKRLADAQILYEAKVQISVYQLHQPQVRVLGAVQRPGSFPFKTGDTVLDAIAQGGSYADDAMLESATLTRKGSEESIPINLRKLFDGDLTQNYVLEDGDKIYIPHEDYNNKIYVLGQVNRPGQYSLKENTTVLAAISLANGQTADASIKNTIIVRGDPSNPTRVKCNLPALFDKGDMSQNIVLQPGDIVVVPSAKKMPWNTIAQIVNTATNLAWLRRVGW